MIRINQVKLPVKESSECLAGKCAALLHIRKEQITELRLLRRSIDGRKKPELYFSYTVVLKLTGVNEEKLVKKLKNRDVTLYTETVYAEPQLPKQIKGLPAADYFAKEGNRPVIVGFGPAGMLAGLLLARAGARPVIYERGAAVEERVRDVEALWEEGRLDTKSNPQFGEGGAGTFSDGKLNTLVKDPDGRGRFVLKEFVARGADPDIQIDAKPHVGTDALLSIVRSFREEILSLGGEIHFHTKYEYTPGEGETHPIVLAIGHSARGSYEELYRQGLHMEAKDFAMGFRVQHPQAMINRALYGDVDAETIRLLGPGAYKLTHTAKSGRGVYSFCMCPGGYVVNSSSEAGRLSVNGMSYHARDSKNANAAIIVTIRKSDYHGAEEPLGGIALQRELESRTYALCDGKIPMERFGDYRRDVLADDGTSEKAEAAENPSSKAEDNAFTPQSPAAAAEDISPVFRGQYQEARLDGLFRFEAGSKYESLNDYNESFLEGMESFGHKIRGFDRGDTILAAVEARTSSPVRIPRNEHFLSNLPGVYPCGEGAGYAGGIMSAAMDGMRVAEEILRVYREQEDSNG